MDLTNYKVLRDKFLELAKKYENLKDEMDVVRTDLTSVMNDIGYGQFVQDAETKIVYQVVKPNGTFIYYKDIDFIRTKKEGEKAGTLSVKKAEEAGFSL